MKPSNRETTERYWAAATLSFPCAFALGYSFAFALGALFSAVNTPDGLEFPLAAVLVASLSALAAALMLRTDSALARGAGVGIGAASALVVVVGVVVWLRSGGFDTGMLR